MNKEYYNNCINQFIKELIKDLENYDANSIVCINYDNGMGYILDIWKERDKVEL